MYLDRAHHFGVNKVIEVIVEPCIVVDKLLELILLIHDLGL